MANNVDLTIWDKRWQALNDTMNALTKQYSNMRQLAPHRVTLHQLVLRLQAFAEKQFDFFRCGLDKNAQHEPGRPELKVSDEFPADYVLSMILNQISYDLEVIQRAADIRRSVASPKVMQAMLYRADQLAREYLQAAQEWGLIDRAGEVTALTYFQKSPSIRITPYAPVALIGIPYTALSSDSRQDLLVTPHEVGHYVYWHGTIPNNGPIYRALNSSLKQVTGLPDWAKNWTEEIFADVFGCLCAGASTALSSQNLALQYSSKDFTKDDEEHPVPALRPLVYLKALKAAGKGELAEDLKTEWEKHVGARLPASGWETAWTRPNGQPGTRLDEAISPGLDIDVNLPVDKIISEVLKVFGQDLSSKLDGGNDIEDLYPTFTTKVEKLPSEPSANVKELEQLVPKDTTELWENWINDRGFFKQPLSSLQEIGPGKENTLKDDPDGTWVHVLFADGWQTEIGNHIGTGG